MPSGVSFKDILTKNNNELFEVDWVKGGVDEFKYNNTNI
jgi:hypothetical protein